MYLNTKAVLVAEQRARARRFGVLRGIVGVQGVGVHISRRVLPQHEPLLLPRVVLERVEMSADERVDIIALFKEPLGNLGLSICSTPLKSLYSFPQLSIGVHP